jgi:hypothetical protein
MKALITLRVMFGLRADRDNLKTGDAVESRRLVGVRFPFVLGVAECPNLVRLNPLGIHVADHVVVVLEDRFS